MRRSHLLLWLALLASSARAAAVSPPGVNLRWDNCYGDGGVWNKTFACDMNSGSERLVCSFELADAFPQVSGAEVYLDLSAQSAQLPAWWGFKNNERPGQNSAQGRPFTMPTVPVSLATGFWSPLVGE